MEGSDVEEIYHRLCKRQGVDGGSPLGFEVYLRFLRTKDQDLFAIEWGDPHDLVDRAANVLAIQTSAPVGLARMMWMAGTATSYPYTERIWRASPWTQWLHETTGSPEITRVDGDAIRSMWLTLAHADKTRQASRVDNAVTYFQHAWRSHHIDQACLHLAVAIEVLFAPHYHSETMHQIAFNTARFASDDPGKREEIYDRIRDFYSVRSTIVHGGNAETAKVKNAMVAVFPVFAAILRNVLGSTAATEQFDDEKRRKQLLRSYLFT